MAHSVFPLAESCKCSQSVQLLSADALLLSKALSSITQKIKNVYFQYIRELKELERIAPLYELLTGDSAKADEIVIAKDVLLGMTSDLYDTVVAFRGDINNLTGSALSIPLRERTILYGLFKLVETTHEELKGLHKELSRRYEILLSIG